MESSDVTVERGGKQQKAEEEEGGKFDGHIPKREEEEAKHGTNTPHTSTTTARKEVARMSFH